MKFHDRHDRFSRYGGKFSVRELTEVKGATYTFTTPREEEEEEDLVFDTFT